jgi:CBS domain-containing protein
MVPVKSVMIPVEKIRKVERDTLIKSAAEQLRDFNIGSLFIVKGGEIIGIFTDTDVVRRCVAGGLDPVRATVEQVMSAPVLMIDENKTLLDANDLMAKSHVRHLGVSRNGKLVGMISVRDLVVFLTNLPRK